MTSNSRTDVAIIGAGPVGLFAVFECGMLKMGCQVIDALDVVGGQCTALYPEKPIYDIPGYPQIGAAELIDKLAEQAAPLQPRIPPQPPRRRARPAWATSGSERPRPARSCGPAR